MIVAVTNRAECNGEIEEHEGKMTANSTNSDSEQKTSICKCLRGGSSIVTAKSIFSPNSKNLLCCSGSLIKVLSVASGECVRLLKGHEDEVTSIKIHPKIFIQMFSASLDASVILWDYTDGALLKRFKFDHSITSIYPSNLQDNSIYILKQKSNVAPEYELLECGLPKSADGEKKLRVLMTGVAGLEDSYSIGHKEEFIACVRTASLRVWHKKEKKDYRHKVGNDIYRRKEGFEGTYLTCVACHPKELTIATGCEDGKIILWRNFLGKSNKVIKTVLHWHALRVEDLAFTAEGSYLLSGGNESVLVKWQTNSLHKDFLPRLGAPINQITVSPDNCLYATGHFDNALQVINNNFKVQQVFQGLTRAFLHQQMAEALPAGMHIDPRTNALVLNGKPGHLQFYSLHNDKHLYNLDIVCQNIISSKDLDAPLAVTEIEQTAFSADGKWLATLERRDDSETEVEMRLKFWAFNDEKQMFVLNTSVDMPHQHKVYSLKFRPGQHDAPMVVTTGADSKFKLWLLVDDTDIYRNNSCWSCDAVGFYRDLPAGKADFSEDGSLLAVAFGSKVTLWEPETNTLKMAFTCSNTHQTVRHLLFGRGRCSHLVVISTEDRLYTWSVLTCTTQWSVALNVAHLIADPASDYMAAFSNKCDLFVFKPSSSSIVYAKGEMAKSIHGALFVPHMSRNEEVPGHPWLTASRIYYMDEKQQLNTLIPEDQLVQETSAVTNMVENLPATPFSQLLNNIRKTGVKETEASLLSARQEKPKLQFLKELQDTPAHTLPPISLLCSSFLETLLIKKDSSKSEETSDDEDEEIDEEENLGQTKESGMDVDSDSEPETEVVPKKSEVNADARKILEDGSSRNGKKLLQGIDKLKSENFEWASSLFGES